MRIPILLSILVVAFHVTPAVAGPLGEDFAVNQLTTGYQNRPSVGMADDRSFVVVWSHAPGDEYTVRGRRFGPDGTPAPSFEVSTEVEGDQYDAALSMAPDGRFVVVWAGPDGDGYGVRGRRFDSSGQGVGGEFVVNGLTIGHQTRPDVSMSSDGRFTVAWKNGVEIRSRSFDASALPEGGDLVVNQDFGVSPSDPLVARSDDGTHLVSWWANDLDRDVPARRVDSAGAPVGDVFLVNAYTTGLQRVQDIAAREDGDFVVSWSGFQSDPAANGALALVPKGSGTVELLVETDFTGTALAPAGGDDLVMVGPYDGDLWGMAWAKRAPNGPPFPVSSLPALDPTEAAVSRWVANPETPGWADLVVVWTDETDRDGDASGIFARRFRLPLGVFADGFESGDTSAWDQP